MKCWGRKILNSKYNVRLNKLFPTFIHYLLWAYDKLDITIFIWLENKFFLHYFYLSKHEYIFHNCTFGEILR